MSLDQRMREGLDRMSAEVEPEVGVRFADATRRAARARRRRRLGGAIAGAALLLAAVSVLPGLVEVAHHGGISREPAVEGASAFPIAPGSYEIRIGRQDALASGVAPNQIEGFAGRYVFTFAPDGSYVWEEATPNAFIKDGGGGLPTRSGDLITFPSWLHGDDRAQATVRVVETSPKLRFAVVGTSPSGVLPFANALFTAKDWLPTG